MASLKVSDGNLTTMMLKRDKAPLVLTTAFVLLVLALNFQIFTRPIVEAGDSAANSLLVQQAKHFRLMTGHYSRWHFMHPGPAFLYLFALGEFLFYDVLHVVPAPYNGQLLITIIFNGALLYAALYVFRGHAKLPVPLALLATEVVAVMVNRSGPPSMLISNWMPDVLVFPFLLFAVSAASVLAGRTRDLVFLAFSGMLLIHAHFAQFLFVGVIGGGTVAYILVRAGRQGGLRRFLSERWREFAVAAAIVFIFALPPLLEIVLDRPNNLDAVLAYLHQFGNARNNLGMAIGYFACFALFIGAPDVALTKGPLGILAIGLSQSYVYAYYLMMTLVFVVAVTRIKTAEERRAPFLQYVMGIGAVSVMLFIYWSTRITGGFQAFNGNFIYALHLLAWFLLLAEVRLSLDGRVARSLNVLALISLVIFAMVESKALRSAVNSQPEVREAAMAAPSTRFGTLAITFDSGDWPWAIGVANSMQRMGKPFCVSPSWGFIFSKEAVCPDMLTAGRLRVATEAVICTSPCRYVYRSAAVSVTRSPAERITLPLDVGLQESPEVERTGFYPTDGSSCWTQKHASLLFMLSPETVSAPCFRLAVTGYAFPGRPMQLGANGRTLGTLSKSTLDTAVFVVPREAIRPGGENRISLETEKAAPVGGDPREIGFSFTSLELRAATPDQSCTVDPAAQPDYLSISMDWAPSCYGLEGTPPNQWRWCGPDSLMVIHNSSSQPRRVTLSTDFSTDHEKAAPLKIRSPFFNDTLGVSSHRVAYTRTFIVPPGDHTIAFTCMAPRSAAPDPRNLVLRFDHFRLEPASGLLP
jgi:hypothetical protein